MMNKELLSKNDVCNILRISIGSLDRMMKRKEDMKRGALKGLHKDLKNSIEQDDELVWPEIYSFLLADIALTLRAIRKDVGG